MGEGCSAAGGAGVARGELEVRKRIEMLRQIAYIAGYGRSGSTLLDMLSSQLPAVAGLGEVGDLYHDLADDSVGPVPSGHEWGRVKEGLTERLQSLPNMSLVAANQRRFESFFMGLAAMVMSSRFSRRVYRESQRACFETASAALGADTVVDSTKTAWLHAWRPLALSRVAGLEVKLVVLVRDGRAVLWSVLKGTNKELERGETKKRRRFAFTRFVLGWWSANAAVIPQVLLIGPRNVIFVDYRSLCAQTKSVMQGISTFLQKDSSQLETVLDTGRPIYPSSQYRGNRMRTKPLRTITEDKEWKTNLPMRYLVGYWLFCLPVHVFYRSVARPRGTNAAPGP